VTTPPVPKRPPVRVALFGMRCAFTLPPVRALLAAPEIDLRAVIVPAALTSVAAVALHALDDTLRTHHVPLVEAPSLRRDDLLPALGSVGVSTLDAIVTACFPWRIPRWLRDLPRLGALNVHPSLLPQGRGPEPAFRALRNGQRQTGVTIHLLDRGWDTGPILSQQPFTIPDRPTLPELETALAEQGGALLVDTLHALAAGQATPQPQDDALATAAPIPTAADLTLPTNLPAAWAARFAHAVAPMYSPLVVLVMATGERIPVGPPLTCDPTGTLTTPIERHGDRLAVRFTPGIVVFAADVGSRESGVRSTD